jgi:flavin-dependent dehydrogenase
VISNGTTDYTRELGVWKGWVNTYVKGAIVLGSFDPNTLIVWINKDYCKTGYAYLTPFNDKRASLALVVTDVNEQEVASYWELFLYTENLKYTITQEFTLNHRSGYVYPHRVGNIYFAGNSGGSIDPFLGFGQYSSITMGVMAARSIVLGEDYDQLIKDVTYKNLQLHEFRKGFDRMSNIGYDILMSSVGLPILKQLIYNTPINVIKYGSALIKLLPKKKS